MVKFYSSSLQLPSNDFVTACRVYCKNLSKQCSVLIVLCTIKLNHEHVKVACVCVCHCVVEQCHLENPFCLQLADKTYSISYCPGDSNCALFGGNSNWRGPVWLCSECSSFISLCLVFLSLCLNFTAVG